MAKETMFTLADFLTAQKALRDASGAEEETFNIEELIGMASDEIEMLKDQGKSDDEIAALMQKATGKPVTGAEVKEHYLTPEEREAWDDDDDD
ncbi:MAG: hypothetical protein NW215_14065 [Hyphomicrobiales bacterium]|nr:hypothetical protein [Hyphomicrobiales bacterium]